MSKRNWTCKITALLCLFFYAVLCVGPGETASNHDAQEGNALTQEGFSKLLIGARREGRIPGIVGVIVTSDGVALKAADGVRKLDTKDLVTLSDRFHIGSNTKAMTGLLAGILVDKATIRWDTKVSEVFPEWETEMRKDYLSVTLRDVLAHRAGILPFKHGTDFEQVPASVYEGSATEIRRAFTAWLLKQPSVEVPAQGHTYSNAGYSVASALLEKASGRSWERMIEGDLFEPLGIAGGPGWPAAAAENQPWGHWIQNGRLVPHDPNGSYQLHEVIAPAGDIHMSVLDYAKFLQMILKGLKGEDTLVKSETLQFLLYASRGFPSYSMGWGSVRRDGLTISSHDGSAGTFYCHAVIVKEHDLAIALMANSAVEATAQSLHKLSRHIVERYRK